MIIQVDAEGRKAVQQLCDIALKQAGLKNLNPVNRILNSIRLLPTPEDIEQGTNLPKSPKKEDEASGQAVVEKQEETPEEEPSKEEVPEDKVEPSKE